MSEFRKKVAHGFGWVFCSTLAERIIQIVALAVTTRILSPEDFGILAVVTAATYLIDRITTFGLDAAIVQSKEATEEMLNVVWSYQLLRNIVLGGMTYLVAPWLAILFKEPAASDMVRFAALGFPISGLRNIGLVVLRREMDFRRLSISSIIPVAIFAASSIGMTIWLENVWALVYSSVILSASITIVSYFFNPHVPKINLNWSIARPLFYFGLWLLGNTLLKTSREQGVVLCLARMVSGDLLGIYNRSVAFSFALFVQAQAMMWRVLYPALSRLQSETKELRLVWRKLTQWTGMIALVIVTIYILFIPYAVKIVLGDKWEGMIPVAQVFAVYAFTIALTAPSEILFQAVGRPGIGTRIQLISTVFLLLSLWPCVNFFGILGAAIAFTISSIMVIPMTLKCAYNITK